MIRAAEARRTASGPAARRFTVLLDTVPGWSGEVAASPVGNGAVGPARDGIVAGMTTRTSVPDALVIPPGTSVPGRARPAGPLRREGPAKLTGTALYTDDIVVPGAWYGATIRSTDAHATYEALELDPEFDWTKVVVVTADDIPGENIVSSIKNDQPILVPVGGEILHHAEPLGLIAAPDKATLREARRRARPRTTKLPAVFDPDASEHVFAAYAIGRGDPDAAFAAADMILEGEYRDRKSTRLNSSH